MMRHNVLYYTVQCTYYTVLSYTVQVAFEELIKNQDLGRMVIKIDCKKTFIYLAETSEILIVVCI